jgi:Nucleotidyl transferase AbiEii toxin, Type IV TA system
MENEIPSPWRIPTESDLVALCRALNERRARYIVIGGFAINHHGHIRATEDIDILIDPDPENQSRIRSALEILPEKAIRELGDEDFRDYIVVRVSDEILVDVMTAACGIKFKEASHAVEIAHVRGVPIPFATPELLLRMKQTYRQNDIADRIFPSSENRRREKVERKRAA